MAYDRFYIAPYDAESGLNTSLRPFLIPDSAFATLTNAYVFRGRVRKRFGSRWLGNDQFSSRLRINLGTTDAVTGNITARIPIFVNSPLPANTPVARGAIGQAFSVGSVMFTVNALGSPANLLRSDGLANIATFDTAASGATAGQVIIQNAPKNLPLYWYPSLPVMGLVSYQTATANEQLCIAFDTCFSYLYVNGGWERIAAETTANASFWSGDDSQYFWGASWVGINPFDFDLFVTNFNENEPNYMRVYNGAAWDNFAPQISLIASGATLNIKLISARILVSFHNHLVALNTWELEYDNAVPPVQNLRNYQFRARWSNFMDPLGADAWRQDIRGQGSGADLPLNQAIITAQIIKDRLIVYAENSTWELVWTGNPAEVFQWQEINDELGAESTFSVVPFDKVAIGIGNVGVHACNGANVERIDVQIPDQVFQIHQLSQGVQRVFGVRDYFVEMVYWSFPAINQNDTFPFNNRVLVYNYKTSTWAFNDDSITVFGYFQPLPVGITWDSTTVTWDDDITWDSGAGQALFRQVIGGNQEGYTFIIDADATTNASVLQITDIAVSGTLVTLKVINHNFQGGEYIYLQGIVDNAGNLTLLNNIIVQVQPNLSDPNNITFAYKGSAQLAGTYLGGGTIARVSQINIVTKQYNFYAQSGKNAAIDKVSFMLDTESTTSQAQVMVNYFTSTSVNNLLAGAQATGALIGLGSVSYTPNALYPYEATSERLWRTNYISAVGEVIQLQITMSDAQMTLVVPVSGGFTGPTFVDFQMHVMLFYARQAGRLQ